MLTTATARPPRARLRILFSKLAVVSALSGIAMAGMASGATALDAQATTHTNREWARLVLSDGGWPTSTNNVTVMLQWMASEEPVGDWYHGRNPLNNTASGGDYATLRSAAGYVVHTLRLSYYTEIRADLAASAAPHTTAVDIQDSPWAASHYGHGSAWHTSAVTTTQCPSSYW